MWRMDTSPHRLPAGGGRVFFLALLCLLLTLHVDGGAPPHHRVHLHTRVHARTKRLQEERLKQRLAEESASPVHSADEGASHQPSPQYGAVQRYGSPEDPGRGHQPTDTQIPTTDRANPDKKPWPALYLYKLGPNYTEWQYGFSQNYRADVDLIEYWNKTGHFVDDPEEADLYLPYLYHYHAFVNFGDGHQIRILERAYEKILERPFWNRSNGVDHMWILTQDHGFCGFAGNGEMHLPQLQRSIIIEHWGLMLPERLCFFEDYVKGVKCFHQDEENTPRLPCFVPEKDVLAPNPAQTSAERDPGAWEGDGTGPRHHTFFFSGSARMQDVHYSQGSRQLLLTLFKGIPGWRMLQSDADDKFGFNEGYEQLFRDSTFCFASTGSGFGIRTKLAVLHNCIPVVVSDAVQLELEDVLPWPEFSLRLPSFMIYRLPEALQLLLDTPGKIESMQRKVACVRRWFTYAKPYGRAGEAVTCSLRRKLAGWANLKPSIDWETCTLRCTMPEGLLRRANLRRKLAEGAPL